MFDALKDLDLDALPADVWAAVLGLGEQNTTLMEPNAALTTQKAELEALNARLEHSVKELNQVIYGTRSEKLTQDERQLAFEDIEVAQSEAEEQSDVIEMTTPRKKRKPVRATSTNSGMTSPRSSFRAMMRTLRPASEPSIPAVTVQCHGFNSDLIPSGSTLETSGQ